MLLKDVNSLEKLLEKIDKGGFEITDEQLNAVGRQISELSSKEFDLFISFLFEYLCIKWDKTRNFTSLRFISEMIALILEIAPEEITDEIERTLRNSEHWHMRFMLYVSLFGGDEISSNFEKSWSTLPLELLILQQKGKPVDDNIIKRILALEDETLYNFCTIVLTELFENSTLTNLEVELKKVQKQIGSIVDEFGEKVRVRIKHVLSHHPQQKNGEEGHVVE